MVEVKTACFARWRRALEGLQEVHLQIPARPEGDTNGVNIKSLSQQCGADGRGAQGSPRARGEWKNPEANSGPSCVSKGRQDDMASWSIHRTTTPACKHIGRWSLIRLPLVVVPVQVSFCLAVTSENGESGQVARFDHQGEGRRGPWWRRQARWRRRGRSGGQAAAYGRGGRSP
jgi:hypothetical protein